MFTYSFSRPVTLLVEFEGVDDVLPDAVQASGDGGHWRHIGISQPDQEAGVLLAERLAGGDFVRPCGTVVLAAA